MSNRNASSPERVNGRRTEAVDEYRKNGGGQPHRRISDPFSLRVLTYNFFTPPFPAGIWKTQRLELFREYLAQYDVVCMQEIFQFGTGLARARMLLRAATEAGLVYYCTGPVPIKCSAQFIDGGLMILSRFPILEQDRVVFKAGVHVDQLASKGALHARLLLAEEPRTELHVFATHLQATYAGAEDLFGEPAYRAVRAAQVAHLRAFIEEKTINSSAPVLLCGDFNVNGREATAPGGGPAAVGIPAAVEDIERGSVPNDPQLSEYSLLMTVLDPNGLGFDLLRLSAEGGYGVHPITFGDVVPCPETGKPLPRETTLTRFADLGRAECLDFIFFWSSGADLQLSAGAGRHAGAASDDEESDFCSVCKAYRKPGEGTLTVADVLHLLATAADADARGHGHGSGLNDAVTATGVPLHEGPSLAILPDLRATRALRFPVLGPGYQFEQLSDHYGVESSLYVLPSGSSRALLQCAADAVAHTHRSLTAAAAAAAVSPTNVPLTLAPTPNAAGAGAGAAGEAVARSEGKGEGEGESEERKASPSSRAVVHTDAEAAAGAAGGGGASPGRHDHAHMCEVYAAMDLVRAALSAWDESRLETARVLRSASPGVGGPGRGRISGSALDGYVEEEGEEEGEEEVEGEEGDTVPDLPPARAGPATRPPPQRRFGAEVSASTPSPAEPGSEGSGSDGEPLPERVRSRSESVDSTSHLMGATPPRSSGPLAAAAAALSRTGSFLSQRGAGRERAEAGSTAGHGSSSAADEEREGGRYDPRRILSGSSIFGAGGSGSAWNEFRRRSSAILTQAAAQLPLEASALTRHVVRGVQALDNEGEAARRVLQAAVGVSARVARDAAVQRGRCAPACQTRARVAAMLAVGALGRIVTQDRSRRAYTAVDLECPTPSEVPELEAGLANEKLPFPARPPHVDAMRRAVDPEGVNRPLLDRLTRVKPLLLFGVLLSLIAILVVSATRISSQFA